MRTDFANKAISDSGASVTRTPVTKTISGNFGGETLTDGTDETITVFIVKKNTKWFADHSGEFEQADGMMLVSYGQTVNKNDKITYLSRVYRIGDVLSRTAGEGAVIYKVCPLYLLE